ncbi:MAG: 50S ribosomal protein L15 [Chlamydiae bacterium]|nr:50S ribosomal protein L15 [Chlamydiota bacterium]
MITLSQLKNTSRVVKKLKRVGRGTGCKSGKTSGRGHKGHAARSGYYKQYGYEGGQKKLYMKIPIRGFTRGRFVKPQVSINLKDIEALFNDGDLVNLSALQSKGYGLKRAPGGLKILAKGELNKKVKIEAHFFSKEALKKLDAKKIQYKEIK